MKVDPASVATELSSVEGAVGSTVVNEANETVGTIDDLIVTPSEVVPYAVLSVGGFLGIGTKYVGGTLQRPQDPGQEDGIARRHQRLRSKPFLNSNMRLNSEDL